MRVKTLKTITEQPTGGGTLTYHAGCVFEVADTQGRTWIRDGRAEDETGKVKRLDLLTTEEAVKLGLIPAPKKDDGAVPAPVTPPAKPAAGGKE